MITNTHLSTTDETQRALSVIQAHHEVLIIALQQSADDADEHGLQHDDHQHAERYMLIHAPLLVHALLQSLTHHTPQPLIDSFRRILLSEASPTLHTTALVQTWCHLMRRGVRQVLHTILNATSPSTAQHDMLLTQRELLLIEDVVETLLHRVALNITELPHQEQQSSHPHLLHDFFHHMPLAMFMKDHNGQYLLVNEPFATTIQCQPEDLIGKTADMLFPPDDVAASIANEHHVLQTGTTIETENVLHLHAEPHTYLSIKFPIYDTTSHTSPETPYAVGSVILDVTNREHMLKTLRASEAHYRAVVEDQTELICRLKRDGTLSFVNDACCRFLGKSRQQIVGSNLIEMFIYEDREPFVVSLHNCQKATPTAVAESRLYNAVGQICVVQWTIRAVCDATNVLMGYQAVGRDITAQVEAEEAYRTLVQHSLQGLMIVSHQHVVFANPIMQHITGYTIDELQTFSTDDLQARLVHPDDRQTISANTIQAIRQEGRIIRNDGEVRWVDIATIPITYRGVESLQIAFIDITERRHSEHELRMSNARYNRAVAAARIGVWDWNIITHEIYLAPNLKNLLGYHDDEIVNHIDAWMQLVHADDVPQVYAAFDAVCRGDTDHYHVDYRMICKDGSLRWMEVHGTVVRDDDGKALQMLGTNMDITELKQATYDLQRRDTILQTVAHAAELFLRTTDWQHTTNMLLEELGSVTAVNSICVVENQYEKGNNSDDDTTCYMVVRYAWHNNQQLSTTTPDTYATQPSEKSAMYLHSKGSYHEAGVARWHKILPTGECIYGDINTFPPAEQILLEQTGIGSVVIAPVFVGFTWWGFVGFHVATSRTWSLAEIGAIRTAAGIIGAAIHRFNVQQLLDKSESEQRKLYRAVEQIPVSIVITDVNGIIEYVNPKFTEVTGYTYDEVQGQTPRILKSFENSPETYEELWQTITSGNNWHGILVNQHKNGNHYYDSVSISPITNSHNVITHFVAVKEDITKRIHSDNALRESEQKFRSVVEQSSDGIFLANEHGAIIVWNHGMEEITGVSRDVVLEQPIWSVITMLLPTERVTDNMRERYTVHVQQILRHGISQIDNNLSEFELRRPDGKSRYVYMRDFPIEANDTYMIGAMMHDITRRRQVEEELRAAQQTAEKAARVKTEFLSNMSHEIRSPLNAVNGFNELLLLTELNPRQYNFVAMAHSSLNALLTVINDILDFSKIEAGKFELNFAPFVLRDCIEEALDVMASRAAEKHLDLAYRIANDVPTTLLTDMARLRQILINLISNAVKFTDVGEVVVDVSLWHEHEQDDHNHATKTTHIDHQHTCGDEPCQMILISVQDTGIGIPKDALSNLFQSFVQVDASTTRRNSGTGLGLAISKRLAHMMGGTLWVESEFGYGSTFHITFKNRATPAEQHAFDRTEQAQFLAATQPHLHGKRVLVVSDAMSSRSVLESWITYWGMHITTTSSEEHAYALLTQPTMPDIIIIDMHKSEREGLDLSDKIVAHMHNHPVRIVLFVSHFLWYEATNNTDTTHVISLTKPIKPAHLYDVFMNCATGKPLATSKRTNHITIDPLFSMHHPLTILLAEDTVANQQVFKHYLQHMGYDVDVVDDGNAVLAVFRNKPYDVILMDVQMPVLDGVQTTKHIRESYRDEDQPWIIALTGYAMEGQREYFLAQGMDDYVSKPVSIMALAEALRHAQRRGKRTHTQQQKPVALPSTQTLPPSDTTDEPLDTTLIQQFFTATGRGGTSKVREFVEFFLHDMDQRLGEMQQALLAENNTQLHNAAHSLKSLSGQIGAKRLSHISKQVEDLTLEETVHSNYQHVLTLVEQAEYEYQRVRDALYERLQKQ